MILGITHSEDGRPIESLEIGLRVAIGLPADEEAGRKAPVKLDHFIFQTKNSKGDWVENKEVTEKIRAIYNLDKDKPIRKLRIFLTTDEIEEGFRTNLEWWSRSELKCRGNGVVASRSINIVPDDVKKRYPKARYVPWTPCGSTCPDFIRKKDGCKPSGDLTFALYDLPKLGSMCGFFTTSKRSIAQIFSSLQQIAGLTHGRLKLIPFEMVLKGGRTRYQDQAGASKTGQAFFVNLEMRDTDQDQLLSRLKEYASRFDRMIDASPSAPRALPAVNRMPEAEKAVIMASEFSTDDDQDHETGPEKMPPGEHEESGQEEKTAETTTTTQSTLADADDADKRFNELCTAIDLSPGRRNAVLQKMGGDLGEAQKFMEKFVGACKELGYDNDRAVEILGKGVGSGFEEMFTFFDREIKKKAKLAKKEAKEAKTEAADPPAATTTETTKPTEAKPSETIPDEMKGW